MARLVLLSEGFTGRTYELKVDKTTVGRIEDNAFAIPEPSVSSHHCEILLRGNDVFVRDLDSTNGTFINGEQISESVLKPGEILRLGQLEMRLETGPSSMAGKKALDQTLVIPQGVKFNNTDATRKVETSIFQRKNSNTNRIFVIAVIVASVIVLGLLAFAFSKI